MIIKKEPKFDQRFTIFQNNSKAIEFRLSTISLMYGL